MYRIASSGPDAHSMFGLLSLLNYQHGDTFICSAYCMFVLVSVHCVRKVLCMCIVLYVSLLVFYTELCHSSYKFSSSQDLIWYEGHLIL